MITGKREIPEPTVELKDSLEPHGASDSEVQKAIEAVE